jgi:hypothetical protein
LAAGSERAEDDEASDSSWREVSRRLFREGIVVRVLMAGLALCDLLLIADAAWLAEEPAMRRAR